MKNRVLLFFVFWNVVVFGQIEDAWVYFNDKPQAQYYLDNPLEMLSLRALDRRTNQNIALYFTDVPIHQPYFDYILDVGTLQIISLSKWLYDIHVIATIDDIS